MARSVPTLSICVGEHNISEIQLRAGRSRVGRTGPGRRGASGVNTRISAESIIGICRRKACWLRHSAEPNSGCLFAETKMQEARTLSCLQISLVARVQL